MKLKRNALVVFIIINIQSAFGQVSPRSVQLLEKGWFFINKDMQSSSSVTLPNSNWHEVTVPHDWAITGPFDMTIDIQKVQVFEDGESAPKIRTGRTGALPSFGVGWYKKTLPINADDKGKRIFIEFDGVMSLGKIFLNGIFIGEWPYGYTSFSFELTKHIVFDKENILTVRVENKTASSRWYTGAGIYRNVRLVKTSDIHIPKNGTYVTTPNLTNKKAEVIIKTEVQGSQSIGTNVKLVTEVYSPNGKLIKTANSTQKLKNNLQFIQNINIENPQIWSIEQPFLYNIKSKIYVDNQLRDTYETIFGCRKIRFDNNTGFFLNDNSVKIKGVCLHHDLGPLGAAFNYRALERQLQMMKEMGANAIRTAHNPPSPELLEICDRLGLLVQVEAFDQWVYKKVENDYHNYFPDWHKRDLVSMIRRDRNHPSIILWSIGNEVVEQKMAEGKLIAKSLVEICHQEDPTRPVTAAFNNHTEAIENGLADELDVVGFNYKPGDYIDKHKQYPQFSLIGSETASTVSSRGEYKFPAQENRNPWYLDYHLSSYDLDHPNWATTPDSEFNMQDDCDFVSGEFVWTGFDYLGEPSPYNEGTPAKSSYFGIVDLAGLKKDRFYLYQSKWSKDKVLHLLPHWNWPERIGQTVPVFCYTNYPKAELFVNGVSMGIREKSSSSKFSRYRLMWNDVIYQPGEIKVIAYNEDNKPTAEQTIKTSGEPFGLKLTADRTEIDKNGKDLSFVTIEVVDKNGLLCPRSDAMLYFDIKGSGVLKSLCNGDPTDLTSFQAKYMRAFNGKLVAAIQSSTEVGEVTLFVSGGMLRGKEIVIKTK